MSGSFNFGDGWREGGREEGDSPHDVPEIEILVHFSHVQLLALAASLVFIVPISMSREEGQFMRTDLPNSPAGHAIVSNSR